MRVLRGHPEDWRGVAEAGSAVTIGVFDGVHLGHRRVLSALRDGANELVVVTFDRHPLEVVAPEAAPKLLTSLSQRIDLFDELGVDLVAVLPFAEVRGLSPNDFVKQVVVDAFSARVLAVGTDFRFGRDRTGDVELLQRLADTYAFELRPVRLLEGEGQPVSSTAIRIMVASGRVEEATLALGRPFELRGIVTHGDDRGKALGVPTANLDVDPSHVVPGHGVYAALAVEGETIHRAAVNVGVRPTFGEGGEVVEVHLLDFEGDLYDEELAVRFVARIRDEQAFETVEALVTQLQADLVEVRARLDTT